MALKTSIRTRVSLLGRLANDPDDDAAWREFVDRYAPLIYGWCQRWRLQEADAQDVTQDVLLRIAQRMRRFVYDENGSFRAWLKTITRGAWSDFLSRQQRPGRGSGDSHVAQLLGNLEAADDLVRHLDQQFELELVEEAQHRVRWRVDSQTWEVYRRTAVEQEPGKDVAAQLGMTVGAVYKAKSRFLKMMQEEVRRLEGEEKLA